MTDPTPVGDIVDGIRDRLGMGPTSEADRAALEEADRVAELQAQVANRLADVPQKFATADVKDFPDPLRQIAQGFVQEPSVFGGLLVYGPTGTGKTHLLWAIFRALAQGLGDRMRIVKCVRMFEKLKDFDDAVSQMDRLLSVPVLGIDDVAVSTHTDWEQKRLYELVDGRYDRMLPLVITTNRKPEALKGEDLLGARTASRLKEACTELMIAGRDRRYG